MSIEIQGNRRLVLKGNDRVIKLYERYSFRFDGTEKEVKLGTPNKELRMIFEKK